MMLRRNNNTNSGNNNDSPSGVAGDTPPNTSSTSTIKRGKKSGSGSSALMVYIYSLITFLICFVLYNYFTIDIQGQTSPGEINTSNNKKQSVVVLPKPNIKIPDPISKILTKNTQVDGITHFIIFSTDCSEFQHWQSYLLFYSAFRVSQPGYVTRIASGCTDEQVDSTQEWFDKHISTISPNFRIHFTPHFSGVKDKDTGKTVGDYKFFNKPFGLRHWMENDVLLQYDSNTKQVVNEDAIIILLDPDMVLMKPITYDFSKTADNINADIITTRKIIHTDLKVQHGKPFAQQYGLGTQWRTFNLDYIAGSDSPSKLVSNDDGRNYYPAGPPYLATARDMLAIATKWTEFVPKVHEEYPNLLAEMFAFCIAAAHLELPHQMIDSLMVSNTHAGGEGWDFVDALPVGEDLCSTVSVNPRYNTLVKTKSINKNLAKYQTSKDQALEALKEYPQPSVIHYCQRYALDSYFFGKRPFAKDFFTCSHPLVMEAPYKAIENAKFFKPKGGEKKPNDAKGVKREGYMVCGIVGVLNEASTYFKNKHCNDEVSSWSKSYECC